MDSGIVIGALALVTAVIGYLETRYRMKDISAKVTADIKAEAKLAAAAVLADALVAEAKIKADAQLAGRT